MTETTPLTENGRVVALIGIIGAIVEAVEAAPDGIPAGTLYAMLMAHGCTQAQFDALMGVAVQSGRIACAGHVYRKAVR